jgi:hypothetical protein
MKLTVIQKFDNQEYNLTIEKNKSIQIDCLYKNHRNPHPTSKRFGMGDIAEYDSYNLSYIGKIIGITDKTITIEEQYNDKVHRLKLVDFCWRNWDFDLEKINKSNAETSMCI